MLGEYTCSSDDSENVEPCKKVKVTKAIESVVVYQCTECPKTYKTMSRFWGHMISKHEYESVGMCLFFFMNYRECKRCVDLTIRQSTIKKVKYMPLFKCYVNFILHFFLKGMAISNNYYIQVKKKRSWCESNCLCLYIEISLLVIRVINI